MTLSPYSPDATSITENKEKIETFTLKTARVQNMGIFYRKFTWKILELQEVQPTFEPVDEPLRITIQMKAIKQYFPVVL